MGETIEFTYEGAENTRLDKLILERLPELGLSKAPTRSQLKNWIEQGNVSINGAVVTKAGAVVKNGYLISFRAPEDEASELAPYSFELSVLYEDDQLAVIDKPVNLTMHPGAGNRSETLANALVHRFGEQKTFLASGRPGIVHRLDRDTSGLVVVARDVDTLNALSAQFAARTVGRAYKALVFTTPRAQRLINLQDKGTIDAVIGRHPTKRTCMAVVKEGGKRAVTHWQVLERMPYGTLVEVRLETGRTHQIRVHMNHIHSPVIGDQAYGDFSGLPHELRLASQRFGRQALHAFRLEFDHPRSGERMKFESPLPADFEALLAEFRTWRGR